MYLSGFLHWVPYENRHANLFYLPMSQSKSRWLVCYIQQKRFSQRTGEEINFNDTDSCESWENAKIPHNEQKDEAVHKTQLELGIRLCSYLN